MTIAEIKKVQTDAFVSDPDVIAKYGLEEGKTFEEQFSVVSLENILFFIVATAIWLFGDQLLVQHKIDMIAILRDYKVHTPYWYTTLAKQFQFGYNLVGDTDAYDNTGLTEEQIEASRVVKFAAPWQPRDKSILYIKVATEKGGVKEPLSVAQLTALTAYMKEEIPDAGVKIKIINAPADEMRLEFDIYYNPLILDNTGRRLDGTNDTPIQGAIRAYLSNLDFAGLYANHSLIDALQKVDGVEQPELTYAGSRYGTYTEFQKIKGRAVPYAGYYTIADKNLLLNFISNEEYI